MSDSGEGLLKILQDLQKDIERLDPTDQDSLVNIGAGLELTRGFVPEGASGLGRLIDLSLEGLQVLYLGSSSDPGRLIDAVTEAVTAICSYLSADSSAQGLFSSTAEDALLAALAADNAKGSAEGECENTTAPASLNDVAAYLAQIEPTDSKELERVVGFLKSLAETTEYSGEACSQLIFEAGNKLRRLVQGQAESPENTFREACSLIEQAIDAAEDGEITEQKAIASQVSDDQVDSEETGDSLPPDADPTLLAEFITECGEYISGAESALLAIETDPDDAEAINTVFRAFHTIKGTSAFLGLNNISELAHKAESLLSRARDKEIRCTGGYADLALRSIDTLKELIASVQDALGGGAMVKPEGLDELMRLLADPEGAGISDESVDLPPRLGDMLVAQGSASREDVEKTAACQGEQPLGSTLVKADAASVSDVAKALRTQRKIAGGEASIESSVRVRTDRLDRLIDMVGELVIAQSMVSQDDCVVLGGHHELAKKVTHLGKIVRELQYLSMSMRMVPLKATFQKMARLVRDVARKSGKYVEFVTEGEDTEIDRNMVDIINDPLVHMVRNAVDHGIEAPDVREQNGKPKTGTVVLRAYHSGGNVVVEMQDDGKGLNREKIVEKAISKGLIDSDKGITDNEVYNLIFEPGFSTVDKVTDLSGRGVGMDVVKKSVEALMGRIDIASEPGKGSTFSIRLPLTLAVTDGMLVKVGQERFIIPTVSIHISFRPEASALSTVNGRGELVMLRGELMPICRLHRLFGVHGAVEDPTQGLLVVVGDGDRRCAILVDELLGQQHVVAKSLGDGVGKTQGISGGAILGDGRVGLILDTAEIESLARQLPSGTGQQPAAFLRVA